MKITLSQLKALISEELSTTTDEILSHDNVEDVVAREDAWAGGQNIHWNVDHSDVWADEKTPKDGYAAEGGILTLTKHLKEMHDHMGANELMLSKEEACKAVISIASSTSCPVTRDALVQTCMMLLGGHGQAEPAVKMDAAPVWSDGHDDGGCGCG